MTASKRRLSVFPQMSNRRAILFWSQTGHKQAATETTDEGIAATADGAQPLPGDGGRTATRSGAVQVRAKAYPAGP